MCYLLAIFYFIEIEHKVLIIFIGHCLDFFDGYLARKLNHCTKFGDYFDHFLDYIFWLYPVFLAPQYPKLIVILAVIYSIFILTEMCFSSGFYKHTAKHLWYTSKLIKNNYNNIFGYLYIHITCAEPLLLLILKGSHLDFYTKYLFPFFILFTFCHISLSLYERGPNLLKQIFSKDKQ